MIRTEVRIIVIENGYILLCLVQTSEYFNDLFFTLKVSYAYPILQEEILKIILNCVDTKKRQDEFVVACPLIWSELTK